MPDLAAQPIKGLVWPFGWMTATAMLAILALFITSCSADEVLNSTGMATLNAYVTGNAGEPWQSR
jgi:phage-related holin